MIFSPLEQFQILPVLHFGNNCFGISITNESFFIGFIFLHLSIFFISLFELTSDKSLLVIPVEWQSAVEQIHALIASLVKENIKDKAAKFYPFVLSLFIFVLLVNLIGLFPYSFTLTSHIVITLTLSLSIFIGINLIGIKKYGFHIFSLFMPGGTPIILGMLLVPIECISYFVKPLSLAIRLFANMMAGHTLLKVIAGFANTLMSAGGIFLIVHFLPLLILIPLFFLELGVALIQSFVFAILICLYINDSTTINH